MDELIFVRVTLKAFHDMLRSRNYILNVREDNQQHDKVLKIVHHWLIQLLNYQVHDRFVQNDD